MCRLLHVEWRCTHKQNIWEYCRDATAPSRVPSAGRGQQQPCKAFVSQHTLTPEAPTADEYRDFCCKFACCDEDKAAMQRQVQYLEAALGMAPGESLSRIPSVFRNRQQKSLKALRKKCQALVKRHEERCEALYYGLGVMEEGDAYRASAGIPVSDKRHSSREPEQHVDDHDQNGQAS